MAQVNPTVLDVQVNAVLGSEPGAFVMLISHLMSAGNEQRGQAEAIFNVCKERHPDALALKLIEVLQSCGQVEIRAMAAILLRKQITRDETYIWPRLQSTTQNIVKAHLLTCVQQEEAKSVVKKLCHTVAELAATIIEESQWPELLPFMLQCVRSDNPRLKESSLLFFAQLSRFIVKHRHGYLKNLHGIFQSCLALPSPTEVRIAAFGATCNFVQNLADCNRFQDLIPLMMQTLDKALKRGEEATAQEALKMLIELAWTKPGFWRRRFSPVVSRMLQIAEADTLEEATRHLAIEFIITLAEVPKFYYFMRRKLLLCFGRFLAILMKMLLDIEDDPAWHAANTEDEDAEETSNYSYGQECLGRLAISLGGNTVFGVACSLFSQYMADPDWKKHHAALITLAQIAEGCAKVILENLEQVVNMVLKSFQALHPRVRWAAINAIDQLSTYLGPVLQQKFHDMVLPALFAAMFDFKNRRVQALAVSVALNFSENCPPESPYLGAILVMVLVASWDPNENHE